MDVIRNSFYMITLGCNEANKDCRSKQTQSIHYNLNSLLNIDDIYVYHH